MKALESKMSRERMVWNVEEPLRKTEHLLGRQGSYHYTTPARLMAR
jgi:hypothetical protein